jgi:hypothetical protein
MSKASPVPATTSRFRVELSELRAGAAAGPCMQRTRFVR